MENQCIIYAVCELGNTTFHYHGAHKSYRLLRRFRYTRLPPPSKNVTPALTTRDMPLNPIGTLVPVASWPQQTIVFRRKPTSLKEAAEASKAV